MGTMGQLAKRCAFIVSLLLVSSLTSAPFRKDSPAKKHDAIAFVHVNVIPMDTERILPDQTVVVKDGRISEINPAANAPVPAGALRIDGRGRYLMPGLADMHVHLYHEAELLLYVANGVTTVRNMRGAPRHLEWRRKIAQGEILGPTLYTTGPTVDGPSVDGRNVRVETAADAERVVAEQRRAGYDFIKVYSHLSKEAYQAIMAAAKRHRISVVGHIPTPVGLEAVLKSGQTTIEHVEQYFNTFFNEQPDETKIAFVAHATRQADIWVTPTIWVIGNIVEEVEDFDAVMKRPETKYVPPPLLTNYWRPPNNPYLRRDRERFLPWMKRTYAFLEKLVRGLREAGVRLLLGTDAPVPVLVPGFSIHLELQNLVKAGLTPYEALRTGTYHAAEALNGLPDFGTVTVGKRADLILVEGNPLQDVAQVSRRAGVMLRGRWLPESELRKKLDDQAASYGERQ